MQEFELKNSKGMRVGVLDYGGILTRIMVPDKNGLPGDVVLGFEAPERYRDNGPYLGAIIGRYANRIANACFTLDGKTFSLKANNGPNNIHGGPVGFDSVYWKVEKLESMRGASLKLSYSSPDMDQGFPGNLECTVVYTLNNANELNIEYRAVTDKATVVAMTNHAYFNLNNAGGRDVRDHEFEIHASAYTPVNEHQIPTGEIEKVAGTPFDFLKAKSLEKGLSEQQMGGQVPEFDHNFVLDKAPGETELVARVFAPSTGRILEVMTTEPGIQFYTPPSMDIPGKNRQPYGDWPAFCLETQHFPDSPNQPDFPSVELRPGEKYESTTIYRFKTV